MAGRENTFRGTPDEGLPVSWRLADLPWLPEPPPDFRARCDALDADGVAARALATHRLDANGLAKLSAAIARVRGRGLDPLVPFRLGLIGGVNLDPLAAALPAAGARHGVDLTVTAAPYGQAAQAALDPGSAINRAELDAVLLVFDHTSLPFGPDGQASADAALAEVRTMRDALRAPAILATVPLPPARLFGSLEARHPGALGREVARFNEMLRAVAVERGGPVLDVAALAAEVGLSAWHDPVQRHLYKLPFAQRVLPLVADHVGRLVGALRGRSRKCLVLDLDGTLWGGLAGEDGPEGVVVGQGSAAGEAHLDLQRTALALRARGIVLAVASKNDEAAARRVFRERADMTLREEHVAVFQANWHDKATNLEAIARALGLGLDALVMLDDDPAERAQVRAALPEVAVPELPADPAWFGRALLDAGYFETAALSGEDLGRAAAYQRNAARAELAAGARDLSGFLASLDMRLQFGGFDRPAAPRIAQLFARTNQFNLTGRRYPEAEVAALAAEPAVVALQARLIDRFGDNGIVTALAARQDGDVLAIENWAMSCRVFGRRLEEAVLAELVRLASERGASTILGRHLPAKRNAVVAELYPRLGFTAAGEADGVRLFRLDLGAYAAPELPFRIERAAGI
jgi:FkbH-like protein